MKRGVNSLATIASIAPWLGLLLTLLGIINSFRGVGGEKSAIMAALAESLAEALAPAALGLLVAIPPLWFYKYLRGELEALDVEMNNTSLELTNAHSARLGRRPRFGP
jgi:biopolymer transport protein ExbB/TolQ